MSILKLLAEVLVLSLLCAGCASGGTNTGGEIVGGILQGVGQGLSGL